jgi:hypothetical protein
MRVWRINEFEWIAGETLLQALRVAKRELGYGYSEMIDREWFAEVPAEKWPQTEVWCEDDPDNLDMTLSDVVAQWAPGVVMSNYDAMHT